MKRFTFILLLTLGQSVSTINAAEPPMIEQLTTNMQTYCLGRYLIDLPQGMDLGLPENRGSTVNDIQINIIEMNKPLFNYNLEKRTKYLQSQHLSRAPDKKALEEIIPLSDKNGVVFNRSQKDDRPNELIGRTFELWSWQDGYFIKMTINAIDLNYVSPERIHAWKDMKSDTKENYAALLEMYSRVSPRKESDIPMVPGLCIPLGFVKGKAGDKEKLNQVQVLSSMPDVNINFIGNSKIKEKDTLLDRLPKAVRIYKLQSSDFKLLRSGHRQSKYGFEFDEMLTRGPTDESVVPFGNEKMIGNYFSLEANSKIGKVETPFFMLDFYNGDRQRDPRRTMEAVDNPRPHLAKPSLSEDDAIKLWDAITSTLRPRPNGF